MQCEIERVSLPQSLSLAECCGPRKACPTIFEHGFSRFPQKAQQRRLKIQTEGPNMFVRFRLFFAANENGVHRACCDPQHGVLWMRSTRASSSLLCSQRGFSDLIDSIVPTKKRRPLSGRRPFSGKPLSHVRVTNGARCQAFFNFKRNNDTNTLPTLTREDFGAQEVEDYFNYMGMLAAEGNYNRLEAMLASGVEAVDLLLLMACSENDTPKVEEVLAAGANPTVKDLDGKTPLELCQKEEIKTAVQAALSNRQ